MKEITVDFDVLNTSEKFYDFISAEMDFPHWFGRNADALHDLLDCADVRITVKNASSAGAWAAPIVSALKSLECVEFQGTEAVQEIKNMKRSDFYYELPEELIAQTPIEPRDSSRMMKIDRQSGEIIHDRFYNICNYLKKGDLLVLNDSKVFPARIYGVKKSTGVKVEFLLLKHIELDKWEVMVRPGRRLKIGTTVEFSEELSAEILDVVEGGNRIVKFNCKGVFFDVLDRIGQMPLPPYIKEKLKDKDRYNTVYCREEGSAAAPTAGLHFTERVFEGLREKGVDTAYVTLHVGLGTFRPVKEENILDHKMHVEHYSIPQETVDKINECKRNGGRVISVGTTSCRTLESAAQTGGLKVGSADTGIFIYPGYRFKVIDGLITNFHLPESTLIMLVSAFLGRERTLSAYEEAIRERYRFFSFGDSMAIL
ncbi:MAG: tRNA preQ1(34) S-adenosylmethionine ribosyltransferase-isomerase QueA [Ruminococcaceae bacterium]|nr:tRNA preQ1(34) S-adenosylmethionine ribosyltransferase-isomerase QueA [Oscillospiraceae bacterium]